MEAETTEKAEPCRDEFLTVLNTCAQCKESYQNRDPKLLPCLHTVCAECLSNLTTSAENCGQVVKCPSCGSECTPTNVIGNLFANVMPSSPMTNSKSSDSEDTKVCTGCEENTSATSYCLECNEYLCDQCVQAHRRVRITKDHTIQPKDSISQENTFNIAERTMLCPVHKQEPLKLYCETCEKLTCRDCQLLGHKDHRYQFVDEAAENYKKFLMSLLEKIREKKLYVENAKTLIEKRHEEITQKEQKVASDVKTFIMKVAQELNKRGKQLMLDLQNICKAKKGQLDKKNKEVRGLSKTLDHTLKFAEFSLEKGNNAALMYTKKSLNHQLKNVLKIRCEVPNPYHVIDMKFGYDPKTPLIQIPTLGSIFVDGIPFNANAGGSSCQASAGQEKATPCTSQAQTVQNQQHCSNNLGQAKIMSSLPPGERPNMDNMHNLSHQQKAMFMLKMKKMQEQQQQQQQQQQQRHSGSGYHPHSSQQMYNRPAPHPTSPSSSSGLQGLHMMTQQQLAGTSPHLSHLPHQSSCISSSNGQNLRGPSYYPPPLKGPHPIQQHQQQARRPPDPLTESLIQINLTQLQERRNQHSHMNQQHQAQYVAAHQARANMYHPPQQSLQPHTSTNNMQNPIVIQPTPDYSEMMSDSALDALLGISSTSPGRNTFVSSHLSDCMHSNQPTTAQDTATNTSRGMKPEEVVRPSCSFANSNNKRLKPEPCLSVSPENDLFTSIGNGSHSSGSRTPTPRAEPTTTVTPSTEKQAQASSAMPDLDSMMSSNSQSQATDEFDSFIADVMSLPDLTTSVSNTDTHKETGKDISDSTAAASKDISDSTPAMGKGISDSTPAAGKGISDSTPATGNDISDSMPASGKDISDSTPAAGKDISDSMPAAGKGISDSTPASGKDISDSVPAAGKDISDSAKTSGKDISASAPAAGKDITRSSGKKIETKSSECNGDDPSEDWCAVCHNGGDLLCCDSCPKVFHLSCHVPSLEVAPSPNEDWFCGLCTKVDDIKLTSPPRSDMDEDKLLPEEIKVCHRVLLELLSHEESTPFHEPVSASVPNYYKIISEPMDLGTIKEKLTASKYNKLVDFFKDIQLIFTNCSTYNLPKSVVGVMGSKLEKFFHEQLKLYAPFVDVASLANAEDSQETETDATEPISPVEPPRKKKRTKSIEADDKDDDDWVVESADDDTDDVRDLKRKFKRKRDSCSSGSDSSNDTPIVHVH